MAILILKFFHTHTAPMQAGVSDNYKLCADCAASIPTSAPPPASSGCGTPPSAVSPPPPTCEAQLLSGTYPDPFVWKWTYTSQTSSGVYTGGQYSQKGYGYQTSPSYSNPKPSSPGDDNCTWAPGCTEVRYEQTLLLV